MNNDTTVIRNTAWIAAWDGERHRYLRDGDIAFTADRIVHVGGRYDGAADRVVDGARRFAMPGLVNLHAHPHTEPAYKGVREDHGVAEMYDTGLYERMCAFTLDAAGQRAGMEMAYAELLLSGVTTLVDLSGPVEGWLDCAGRSGLRIYVGPYFADARWRLENRHELRFDWNEAEGRRAFDTAVRVMEEAERHPGGRLRGIVFPGQIETCAEATLRDAAGFARDTRRPLTTHISQSKVEFLEIVRRHGKTPLEYAADIGFLGPDAILGHAIFIDEHPDVRWRGAADLDRLAASGASVAHCPSPFARYGQAMNHFGRYRARGVNVGLGTDVAPHNLAEEMRLAILLTRVMAGDIGAVDTGEMFRAAPWAGRMHSVATISAGSRRARGRISRWSISTIPRCARRATRCAPSCSRRRTERFARSLWMDGRWSSTANRSFSTRLELRRSSRNRRRGCWRRRPRATSWAALATISRPGRSPSDPAHGACPPRRPRPLPEVQDRVRLRHGNDGRGVMASRDFEARPGAIGRPLPRRGARRLVFGRGKYAGDLRFPGLLHLAFVRSPYAHARILKIDPAPAFDAVPDAKVFTGADIAAVCAPWQGKMDHLPTMISPLQHAVAVDRAVWQGEPVAAVVAASRALAEDAAAEVVVEWEPLPAAALRDRALDEDAAPAHPGLGSNLAYAAAIRAGDADVALAGAAHVVEGRFSFARHTGVPLEPRVVIADYDPGEGSLTVYGGHQAPWHQQDTLSRHLDIPEHLVRVVTPDIGGGFGIKLHIYGEEIAVSAVSKILGRPVKYAADRMESFVSDVQARDQRVEARMGVDAKGGIHGLTVAALSSFGAYASYGRPPVNEGMMTISMAGGPYANEHYEGRLRIAFQNMPPSGMYRAVGQPIACAVTEQLLDWAAHAAGIDPVEMRRRNYWAEDAFPLKTPGGVAMSRLSLRQCLDKLVSMMGYEALRAEQATLRRNGVYRGIGVATFLEMTAIGAERYGPAGARISTQDGATVRLEPSGWVRCVTSVIEIGQGTHGALAQIVADRLGVAPEDVGVVGGDTALAPYGGGAWASRGLTIGGEAVWRAAEALRGNVLDLAGAILQADPAALDLAGGAVCDRTTGEARIALAEIGRIGHFRQDTLPPGALPELAVTRHYAPDAVPFALANGVQGSLLEVDPETGAVTLLGHWVVEDCGRIVNPLLVEEQIRGGVAQGIGGALFEECRYDEHGQMLNGSLADYLVPMAAELPDIYVGHVETPLEGAALGAKGAGEAGTVGAPAAVMLAVNDALRPLGAQVSSLPITPAAVLRAVAAAA